jgi:hypothetical protein
MLCCEIQAIVLLGDLAMIRLTYISTARQGLDEAATAALLATSQRNNRRAGLTGLLLYDGVRFLQALEGEAEPLLATFARIKADPRHRACVELGRTDVDARSFGEWHMAWQRIDTPGDRGALIETIDRLVARVPDPTTRALFTSFARLDRHAA